MKTNRIVVDLGFGDAGKGSWVDHLAHAHDVSYVCRFNGGSQAAHYVTTPTGDVHMFAQFGAGMFRPKVQTLLSRFMLVEPHALEIEANHLENLGVSNPLQRILISRNCPIITPFNRILNRIQEIERGGSRHGSCGNGIGITQGDVETLGDSALYARDLHNAGEKFHALWRSKVALAESLSGPQSAQLLADMRNLPIDDYLSYYADFARVIQIVSDEEILERIRQGGVVFEGAQGVLLDQSYGFFPHVTRSNTTFHNANELLAQAGFDGEVERTGLLRAYHTRHGAGPFPTETTELNTIPSCHNQLHPWQGHFRNGWFDVEAARYAISIAGEFDTFAITNLDRLSGLTNLQIGYQYAEGAIPEAPRDHGAHVVRTSWFGQVTPQYISQPGWSDISDPAMHAYLDRLGELVGRRVSTISVGPHRTHKFLR